MARELEQSNEGFSQVLLGKLLDLPIARKILAYPADWRIATTGALLAALLFIPYLGAVGLWDPWETHYGEVAREMIHRNDYVHPYWENAWFFSKPAFTMWMQALGMKLVGANTQDGALGLYTEWGFRMPFALFSVLAVFLMTLALTRVAGRRVGLCAALVLSTMPLYFLITRQAVTDTPMISAAISAMACAIIGQLDSSTQRRSGWWYACYVFSAIGCLAKGLLGLLPGAVVALYLLISVMPWSLQSWDEHLKWLLEPSFRHEVLDGKRPMPTLWGQFFRMRLGTGLLVFAAVAVPWYAVMSAFQGVDDESRRFFDRFFLHDHFGRMGAGVHTTTPGGRFIYFIEQGGYAIFPWVALVPGAIAVVARLRMRSKDPAEQVGVIAALWLAVTFTLFSASATKFHHYLVPMLPPMAILIALFIDRLWSEGIARHGVSLLFGLPLFALVGKDLAGKGGRLRTDQTLSWTTGTKNFTDLFVYNYDRAYPAQLVERPIGAVLDWAPMAKNGLSLALLAAGGYLAYDTFVNRSRAPILRALAALLIVGGAALRIESLTVGDLAAIALLGVGSVLALDAFSRREPAPLLRSLAVILLLLGAAVLVATLREGAVSSLLLLGLAFAMAAAYVAYEAMMKPQTRLALFGFALLLAIPAANLLVSWLARFFGMAVPDPLISLILQKVNVTTTLGFAFAATGVVCVVAALAQSRLGLFGGFAAFALGFALWFNWSHWVELSHHWTQRDLFWRYYRMRQPDEPITAYFMNWRGETFYSKNTVKQIKDNGQMQRFANQPGREWALVEQHRLNMLKAAVGSDKSINVIDKDLNNKFVLVTID